jgi:hypothetical protein
MRTWEGQGRQTFYGVGAGALQPDIDIFFCHKYRNSCIYKSIKFFAHETWKHMHDGCAFSCLEHIIQPCYRLECHWTSQEGFGRIIWGRGRVFLPRKPQLHRSVDPQLSPIPRVFRSCHRAPSTLHTTFARRGAP